MYPVATIEPVAPSFPGLQFEFLIGVVEIVVFLFQDLLRPLLFRDIGNEPIVILRPAIFDGNELVHEEFNGNP